MISIQWRVNSVYPGLSEITSLMCFSNCSVCLHRWSFTFLSHNRLLSLIGVCPFSFTALVVLWVLFFWIQSCMGGGSCHFLNMLVWKTAFFFLRPGISNPSSPSWSSWLFDMVLAIWPLAFDLELVVVQELCLLQLTLSNKLSGHITPSSCSAFSPYYHWLLLLQCPASCTLSPQK